MKNSINKRLGLLSITVALALMGCSEQKNTSEEQTSPSNATITSGSDTSQKTSEANADISKLLADTEQKIAEDKKAESGEVDEKYLMEQMQDKTVSSPMAQKSLNAVQMTVLKPLDDSYKSVGIISTNETKLRSDEMSAMKDSNGSFIVSGQTSKYFDPNRTIYRNWKYGYKNIDGTGDRKMMAFVNAEYLLPLTVVPYNRFEPRLIIEQVLNDTDTLFMQIVFVNPPKSNKTLNVKIKVDERDSLGYALTLVDNVVTFSKEQYREIWGGKYLKDISEKQKLFLQYTDDNGIERQYEFNLTDFSSTKMLESALINEKWL